MAPKFTADALAVLEAKKNVRVLEVPLSEGANRFEIKRVGGGLLVQTPDIHVLTREDCTVVSTSANRPNKSGTICSSLGMWPNT